MATLPLIEPDAALDDAAVLDVRQDREWAHGHLSHARHEELGALAHNPAVAPAPNGRSGETTAVMCAHGQRSMTAASLLARARGTSADLAVVSGSAEDWAQATGQALQTS